MKKKVERTSVRKVKPLENIKVIVEKGTILPLHENGKYLLILPKDANITKITPAIAKFFYPIPVFVLAVNDVTEYKIAELLGESSDSKVQPQS